MYIAAAIQGLSPLLTSQAHPFEEALGWLQFNYTEDWTRYYVAPASTVLVQSAVVDGDELFPDFYRHLQKIYPGAYAPSTLVPWTDYPVAPNVQASNSGEYQLGEDGGERLCRLINIIFSDLGTSDLGTIRNLRPSVSRMNNLSPNVTTDYFNTSPAIHMPDLSDPAPPDNL